MSLRMRYNQEPLCFHERYLPTLVRITVSLEPTNLHDFLWIPREQVFLNNSFYFDSCYPYTLCEFLCREVYIGMGEISLSQLPTGPKSPAPKVWQTFTGATLIDYVCGYYVQVSGKLNAVKISVVFLLFWGYLQQTWARHYVASVILDMLETRFSFIVYQVTCYRCMTRRRKT